MSKASSETPAVAGVSESKETHRERLERVFPVDACERLARSEYGYYKTHGNYVPPLAQLVNATRHERDEALNLLAREMWASDEAVNEGVDPEDARNEWDQEALLTDTYTKWLAVARAALEAVTDSRVPAVSEVRS